MTRTIRRSTRHATPFLALSTLVLVLAVPVAAETPAQPDCGPSLAFLGAESPESLLFGGAPAAPTEVKRGGEIDDPGALATCTVSCDNGTYVSCTGSSCSKWDRDCSADEPGHCTATGGVYEECSNSCEVCVADCWDGSEVVCSGSSCTATDSNCNTGVQGHCTGESGTQYCPSLPGPCDDSTTCTQKHGTYCSGTPRSSDCTFSDGCGCGSCFCDTFANEWICTL